MQQNDISPCTGQSPLIQNRPSLRLTRVTKKQLQEAAKAEAKKRKAAKERAETTKVKVAVPLTLSIMNGYMRLSYDEGDKKTMKVLQGF